VSDPFARGGDVRLKPGRETSVLRRHPWIYRGALAGPMPAGQAPVAVVSARGRRLGIALPGGSGGSLALRVVAFGDEPWDATVLRGRVIAAARLRDRLSLDADAYRVVHAEGDDLPGLVVDRYGEIAVIQVFERAWEPALAVVTDVLVRELGFAAVLLRSGDAAGGTPAVLHGRAPGAEVVVREGSLRFPVDLERGQKTGFFLDQRENRRRVTALARGARVLNLFSYSGGFAVAALAGGAARATNVDASDPALELARRAYALNGFDVRDDDFVRGDAFRVARSLAGTGDVFDVVVADPPAFVKRKSDLGAGMRGYKEVNLQAMRLVRPGGLLLTCSCSALVNEASFGRAISEAAADAGRAVRVLERRAAGPDHPVSPHCPESAHLKAWLCAVNSNR